MNQVSWRAPKQLVERVRIIAASQGRSMNDFMTRILDVATSPDARDPEEERLRGRLERAGLLVVPLSWDQATTTDAELALARAEAAEGTALAALISDDRR